MALSRAEYLNGARISLVIELFQGIHFIQLDRYQSGFRIEGRIPMAAMQVCTIHKQAKVDGDVRRDTITMNNLLLRARCNQLTISSL